MGLVHTCRAQRQAPAHGSVSTRPTNGPGWNKPLGIGATTSRTYLYIPLGCHCEAHIARRTYIHK